MKDNSLVNDLVLGMLKLAQLLPPGPCYLDHHGPLSYHKRVLPGIQILPTGACPEQVLLGPVNPWESHCTSLSPHVFTVNGNTAGMFVRIHQGQSERTWAQGLADTKT